MRRLFFLLLLSLGCGSPRAKAPASPAKSPLNEAHIYELHPVRGGFVAFVEYTAAAYPRGELRPHATRAVEDGRWQWVSPELILQIHENSDGITELVGFHPLTLTERWRLPPPVASWQLSWSVEISSLVVLQLEKNAPEDRHWVAIDPNTGQVRWHKQGWATKAYVAGDLLIVDRVLDTAAVRVIDGEELWSRHSVADHLAANASWVAAGDDQGIEVLDTATGQPILTISLPLSNHQAAMQLEGNVLYVLRETDALTLHAFDLPSGAVRWTTARLETPSSAVTFTVGPKNLYACTGSGVLVAWDKTSGTSNFSCGFEWCWPNTLLDGLPEMLMIASKSGLAQVSPSTKLPQPRVIVEGRVTDLQGKPVPGAKVWGGLTQTTADGRGHYRLDMELAGRVCLMASGPLGGSEWRCFDPPLPAGQSFDLRAVPPVEPD